MSLVWRRMVDTWELRGAEWPFTVHATVRRLHKQQSFKWYAHVGSEWSKFEDKPTALAWATAVARMKP
jgi:hypothetical protein